MTHKTGGTNATKDVIYIDVDDEITGIIDKVHASDKKIVALVLPKRATVLQSIVNMKLLKRAATDTKKNLVLITSESGLMPLAGSVDIHVAKSLSSKPEIPDAPERSSDKPDTIEEDGAEDLSVDRNKPVGELAGASADPDQSEEEAIELDDDDAQPDAAVPSKAGKPAKNKKFRIPNFNKFRLLLVLGAVGILVLGSVGYAALAVWPKAKITIKTDSEAVSSTVVLTLKTAPDAALDAEKATLPAQLQEVKKTLTQEAAATGQLNNGEKAVGSVEMIGKDCSGPSYSPPADVPAGSGISTGGNTYITQKKASISTPNGPNPFDGTCFTYRSGAIDIVAQTGGAKFNVSSAAFIVAGRSDVTATGSASGGTDNIVKVVSQADIDGAKQKITEQDTAPIRQELKSALIGRDLYPLDATFAAGNPETKLSAEANTSADSVTVTQTIGYTMLGVKEQDIEKAIASDVGKKIDTKKQSILSYGLDNAFFSLQGVNPEGALVSLQTKAVAGAALNVETLKKQVAGKKAGDAKELISANPGVTDVTVTYSPFWVGSIPKRTDKITIVIEEPKATVTDDEQSP